MDSHRKGDLTEAIVVAELKRRGVPISKPVGDNERYDLIAETDAGLWTLQVKTGWLRDGTIRFHGTSQHTNSRGNVYESYDGDVDYFVVYADAVEELYLVEESVFHRKMRLRVEDPERADRSINWARDYEFDRNWPPEEDGEPQTGSHEPFVERFVAQGIPLFLPKVESPSVDAVAEGESGELYQLGFERGWIVDGRIRFDTGNSSGRTDADRVDYVLVFCEELDELYVVERDSYDSTISLRIESPKQPNSRINWAEEYEFPGNWPE